MISDSTKRLLSLMKKEILQIIRDPSVLIIAFILPSMLLFLYGYAFNLDNNVVKVAIVTQDTSRDIDSLKTAFSNSKFFQTSFFNNTKNQKSLWLLERLGELL